jgi:hypothetical protein
MDKKIIVTPTLPFLELDEFLELQILELQNLDL